MNTQNAPFKVAEHRKFVRFMLAEFEDGMRYVVAYTPSQNIVKDFWFNLTSPALKAGDLIGYDDLNSHQRREVREWFVEIQEGKCCHCGELLSSDPLQQIKDWEIPQELFPTGFLKYPVHLHHDHIGGAIIGAVHAKCNAHSWVVIGV